MEVKEAFRFCPRCGAILNKNPNNLKCSSCDLSYYINPKPAQSLILKNDSDEYLFVVRAVEPRKGFLDFPGGFVEEEENFEQTTRREALEEIGVEVGQLEYLSTHSDEYLFDGIIYRVVG